jgi:predicted heme/steroid binding protein
MSANSSAPAERRFTLADLKSCDGSDPALPALIAHAGRVYDVSRSYPWARGRHWGDHRAGQDQTGQMDPRIHGAEMLARVPCVGVLEDGPALAVLMIRVLTGAGDRAPRKIDESRACRGSGS